MTILFIDRADVANALSQATGETVVEFNPSQALKEDITSLTLVARTRDNAATMGNQTPEDLAENFAKIIPQKKRHLVEHIYLVGDEMGRLKLGGLSLAQCFVNAMYEQGFKKLYVHAIASPGVPSFGMGIEIVTDPSLYHRKPVGQINAFYYRDQYSADIDNALSDAFDTVGSSQKRAKSKALILARNNNRKYQKVDILSADNYKDAMQQPCYTFKPNTNEPAMSAPVSYAINYLSSQKKYLDFVSADIRALRENPLLESIEIIAALNVHKDQPKAAGRYYKVIAEPLVKALAKENFNMIRSIEPTRELASSVSALHTHGLFSPPPILIDSKVLREQLEQYKTLREGEWWGFHYNFLGIISVLYFISDCLQGTDYYYSKHRNIKISATDKLLAGRPITAFTQPELGALREGRLGKIISDNDGLDRVLAALKPKPVDPDEILNLVAQLESISADRFETPSLP